MTDISLQELLEAGCHFGHQGRRWNPLMKKYIYGERDGVHIFDLVKTKSGLDQAAEYLAGLKANSKTILYVGTKRQASDLIKADAIRAGMPYVNVRWMGGTLTNFVQIRKSIAKLLDLSDKKQKGELKKYTKKEQLLIDRDIAKLNKFFSGVVAMEKLPDALFVVDTHKEEVAVLEAKRMGIPVVGIVDTNSDPTIVDYVIPANDDAEKSVKLIVNHLTDVIFNTKKTET